MVRRHTPEIHPSAYTSGFSGVGHTSPNTPKPPAALPPSKAEPTPTAPLTLDSLTADETEVLTEALAGFQVKGWLGISHVAINHLSDPGFESPERHLRDYPSAEAFMQALEADSRAVFERVMAGVPPCGIYTLHTGHTPDVDALVRWAETAGDAESNITAIIQPAIDALAEVCRRKLAREAEAEGGAR